MEPGRDRIEEWTGPGRLKEQAKPCHCSIAAFQRKIKD
jgi:hypothetical protein